MLSLFVLMTVSIGFAQEGIKVTIPVDFTIGKQSFSAGNYTIGPLPMSLGIMLLRNQAGQVLTTIQTNPAESKDVLGSAKLVFNRYGGCYFLAEIWEAGNEFGRQLIKSSAEIEMATAYHSPARLVAVSSVSHR